MRRRLVALGCLGLLFLGSVAARSAGTPTPGPSDPPAAASPARTPGSGTGVVAYYLHANLRCQSCLLIEQRSGEVIEQAFGKELQEGLLAWNVVNTQVPGNGRFATALGLPSRGLVLVAFREGNPERWKNLDGVWELVHGDPVAFRAYVSGEIRRFLEPKP